MLTEPLPSTLDIRKAAARGVSISGAVKAVDLPRFLPLLAAESAAIDAFLECSRDEENRYLVQVTATAEVSVECQRCLETFGETLQGSSRLALVYSDEQAAQLPREYEPLIAVDEVDLWEVAAEELALALPVVAYHANGECSIPREVQAPPEEGAAGDGSVKSPFSVLSALLDGEDAKN